MTEGLFTEQEIESVVAKLGQWGNTLTGNERKLLDLLISSATKVVTIRGKEDLFDINNNLEEATRDALIRFKNSNSDMTYGGAKITEGESVYYGWRR
jgi:hypothetical protein